MRPPLRCGAMPSCAASMQVAALSSRPRGASRPVHPVARHVSAIAASGYEVCGDISNSPRFRFVLVAVQSSGMEKSYRYDDRANFLSL